MSDTSATIEKLEAFFRQRSDVPDSVKVTDYEPITGGYSRLMARVWVEDAGDRVGYVVRSDPPPGHSILETDRRQEWDTLTALHRAGTISMPAPRWFDPGEELDSPAIVLDLIDADNLLVVARSTDTDAHGELIEPLAQAAASIHTFDLDRLPAHLDRPSAWDAYIDSRIQRWIDAEAAHVEPIPLMRLIAAWLDDNRPAPAPFTLVHGDFQVANVLVDRSDRSFLLVDWELTHVGDPREDLGWWALASVTQPPDVIAAAADDFYPRYRELTGLSEEQVNPATVAYFTVLASDSVFINVIEQLAGVAREETTNMTITYMSNAVAGMHDVFMNAMAAHDALKAGAA